MQSFRFKDFSSEQGKVLNRKYKFPKIYLFITKSLIYHLSDIRNTEHKVNNLLYKNVIMIQLTNILIIGFN